jgi:DNA invertase Pin-like site-specific DNA recombinase
MPGARYEPHAKITVRDLQRRGASEIAKALKIGRTSVYRLLDEQAAHRAPRSNRRHLRLQKVLRRGTTDHLADRKFGY